MYQFVCIFGVHKYAQNSEEQEQQQQRQQDKINKNLYRCTYMVYIHKKVLYWLLYNTHLHVRHRADAHLFAELPVAVEADVREGHLLAVHVAELGRRVPELSLDRLGSVAHDGVELDHHQGVGRRRRQQAVQVGLALHRLWNGGRAVGPKLSVIPDPLLVFAGSSGRVEVTPIQVNENVTCDRGAERLNMMMSRTARTYYIIRSPRNLNNKKGTQ